MGWPQCKAALFALGSEFLLQNWSEKGEGRRCWDHNRESASGGLSWEECGWQVPVVPL